MKINNDSCQRKNQKWSWKISGFIFLGLYCQAPFAQEYIRLNSGDYTVPQSHVGFKAIATTAGGSAGTLVIPTGASLESWSTYSPYGVLVGGSISTIKNQGQLLGGSLHGLLVEGSVGTLTNDVGGSIISTSSNAIEIMSTGVVSNITNNGTLTGSTYEINNAGTITTLNNAQAGLRYNGNLPSTYKVIITSLSSYGKTTFSNVAPSGAADGKMTFGIGSGSTINRSNTYADVLIGVRSENLANTSGTLGGGIVATPWTLTNTSGNNWSLTTTLGNPVAPTISSSSSASSQVKAITDAYSIAFSSGSSQLLANGTPFVSAVQGLTTNQVNQLINVHAEGYSSNMTIGLEQMGHITNTVMDRIHAPMRSSPTTKVYQDDEGRYVWADAAAVKGTVNNYNNLAGFGYNLYDLIIGGDIKRAKDGGYGVFAGTGTTSMTESQQVTQNFNTTNFYAGLYGAHNFTQQVKLSGALGYMYGNTNANRNTPSVGQFTGGNATSSYKTNGVYGAAKLAKAHQFRDVTVSPFVGASYSQLWMGGASEQGGNDFNFGINSATAYTAVTFAGADFMYPLLKGVNNPLSLIGFYKFGYDWYANSNSAHSITATSPTYGSFTQVGANMGPVSNMFGLGIQGGISKDVSARIGLVASANSYGQEYGGGAALRVKF